MEKDRREPFPLIFSFTFYILLLLSLLRGAQLQANVSDIAC